MSGVAETELISQMEDRLDEAETRIRQLENELDQRPVVEFEDPTDPKTLKIDGLPIGKIIASKATTSELETTNEMVDELWEWKESGQQSSGGGGDRDLPFPLYRMLADLQDGQDVGLDKTQRRAARLFERFVNKAKGVKGAQNVSTDGQKYAMTTEQATGILEDEGLLDDVKEQSKSRITGRVMREVQRFTIVDTDGHEDCDGIDGCSDHGVVHFRPGKPHTLTVRKGQMKGVVRNASVSDKDVRTADDGESVQNSPEEGSDNNVSQGQSEMSRVTSDD